MSNLRAYNGKPPIGLLHFYQPLSTKLLTKMLKGWERDFDLACQGDGTRQPKEWLIDRINLLAQLLEERKALAEQKAEEPTKRKQSTH